jgi:SAM-dependent methyltransferase
MQHNDMDARDSTKWFQDWFDEDYLTLYAHRDALEARRFVKRLWSHLELRPGVRVADVPCGAGRYSFAFAERGAHVVGVDLSAVMLARAVADAADLGVAPLFVRGDLRRVPLRSEFHVVANVFSSLGYFDDERDNRAVFAEFARLLRPQGVLLVDVINPPYLRAHFVAETRRDTAASKILEWRELDRDCQRVTKRIEIHREGETRTIRESVRLYDQDQLVRLAREQQLTPVDFWGDYDGTPFTPESPRLILFAKK